MVSLPYFLFLILGRVDEVFFPDAAEHLIQIFSGFIFCHRQVVEHVEAAAIKAVETVDACVGKAVEAIKEVDGQLFICAHHGNAEQLVNYETGEPWTAHTTNPVPFILVNADPKYTLRENGCLADIVPTLIQLMGMEQPKEMTGESLLVEK